MKPGWHYHADIIAAMVGAGLIGSKSEGRRLLRAGAVEVDGLVIDPEHRMLAVHEDDLPVRLSVRVGKHRFFTVRVEP